MAGATLLENKIIERHLLGLESKLNVMLENTSPILDEVNVTGNDLSELWDIIKTGITVDNENKKLVYKNPESLEAYIKEYALDKYLNVLDFKLTDTI